MQTFLSDLFPWLVGLYLLDGVAVIRPFERLYVSRWAGGFSVLGPGLQWVSLRPSAEVVAVASPPFFVSDGAVHLLPPSRKDEPVVFAGDELERVELSSLGKIERTHRTLSSPALKLKAPTPAVASRWAQQLGRLAQAPPADRVREHTRGLGEAVAEVRELRHRAQPWLSAVQITSSTMTGLLFTALPLAIYAPETKIDLARLLMTVGILDVATVVLGAIALSRARVPAEEITSTVMMLLLLPVQAMRAPSHLMRQAFLRFDEVSVAQALLDDEQLAAVAHREQQRMRFSAERAPEVARCFDALAAAWNRVSSVTAPTHLLATDDAARYCPICIAQYQARAEACSDCDVPLVEIDRRGRRRSEEGAVG